MIDFDMLDLDEEFDKLVNKCIRREKVRRKIIKNRIDAYLEDDGTIAKVVKDKDHNGEAWCGWCNSRIGGEPILDGYKKPTFCPECGVLLDWTEDDGTD